MLSRTDARPDRQQRRCQLGLLALASDHAIEEELRLFLPSARAALYTTRMPSADLYDAATLGATGTALEAAAALLVPASQLDVLAFGCTSAAILIGEAGLRARLARARPGAQATTPITAALAGLRALGARRLALLTPYIAPVHDSVAHYLEQQGLTLVDQRGLGLQRDAAISALPADDLVAAVLGMRRRGADAVFLSCTALRTATLLEPLEARLGLPVVSSNQALAWHALRLAGDHARVARRGLLLRRGDMQPVDLPIR